MIIPEYVLIVASSGRMLAQAAKRAGYKPFVIDLYADSDTRSFAQAYYAVSSLALADLIPAVETFLATYPVTHAIYGSGFENHPDSLRYLNERLTLCGNHPRVFNKLLNKKTFFSMLDTLAIPYPAISFTEPKNSKASWLIKPLQGQGGVGIKHYYQGMNQPSSTYWQRYVKGQCYSVLFLADGKQMQIIGFNQQWSTSHYPHDFIFSGITNDCDIPNEYKTRITKWLHTLICVFAIKGLNSLDFICTNDECYVLEINARPPASMQLYDDALFTRHMAACRGQLDNNLVSTSLYRGYQIVYATQDTFIPKGFIWPYWCCDLPEKEALIYTGQPICSIIASHKQSQQVTQQLVIRQQRIIDQLDKVFTHGI